MAGLRARRENLAGERLLDGGEVLTESVAKPCGQGRY
jgi:hypothetical protein